LSVASGLREAEEFLKTINSSRAFLVEHLPDDSIVAKLENMSLTERRSMFISIEPRLITYAMERRVTFNEIKAEEEEDTRMALLNPCCNVELLVRDPAYLVYLLDVKIHRDLSELVPFEENELRRGWTWNLLREDYIPSGCFQFTKETYGQYISEWNSAQIHQQEAYPAPRGLLLLEKKKRKLEFLRKAVAIIMTQSKIPRASCRWIALMGRDPEKLDEATSFISSPCINVVFDCSRNVDTAESQLESHRRQLQLLQIHPDGFHRQVELTNNTASPVTD
jgi:hypothetical protein